jgi:hypothetical protein
MKSLTPAADATLGSGIVESARKAVLAVKVPQNQLTVAVSSLLSGRGREIPAFRTSLFECARRLL